MLKKVIKKMQNLLKVNLGMAIEIEIFDTFEDKVIYKQYFFAEKTYIENKNKIMRSDAANVCELTEAVLERAFISIKIKIIEVKLLMEKPYNLSIHLHCFNLILTILKKLISNLNLS